MKINFWMTRYFLHGMFETNKIFEAKIVISTLIFYPEKLILSVFHKKYLIFFTFFFRYLFAECKMYSAYCVENGSLMTQSPVKIFFLCLHEHLIRIYFSIFCLPVGCFFNIGLHEDKKKVCKIFLQNENTT